MKKTIFRNVLKVLAVGGAAAGMSAAAIGLAGMAAWIYCTIPAVDGYAAVVLFALATLTAAVSLAIVYLCGCWALRKGSFTI